MVSMRQELPWQGNGFVLKEVEELVLGTVLSYPEQYPLVSWVRPEDFFYRKHAALWRIVGQLSEEGKAVAPKVVQGLYNASHREDRLEDREFERLLSQRDASALLHGAHLLKDAANRRLLAARLQQAMGKLDRGEAPEVVLDEVKRVEESLYAWDEILDTLDRTTEEALRFLEGKNYVPTGIAALDELLAGGLVKGGLTVIAARPSMGKTALARYIVRGVVAKGGRVYWASFDQSPEQILLLEVANKLNVPLNIIRMAYGEEPELQEEVKRTLGELKKRYAGHLHLDGRVVPVELLVHKLWRLHRREPLDVVVVDYLQFVPTLNGRATDIERVSQVSKTLKAFAVESKVAVVALAQLSREVERRVNKRPVLADLRDSGQVEQDADVILFLHRPAYYDPDENPEKAEIIVGKNKLGPTGVAYAGWEPNMGEFV